MLDGMMCVTYLIKEDLMSTSISPGVRRATAEIHANELGFIASLVSSSEVVQNGCVGRSPSAFQLPQQKPKGKQAKRWGVQLAGFVSGLRNKPECIMGQV
jgi:hypothetical protein